MLKKLLTTPLIYIFILGFFLRTWNLTSLPPGFHVDEVKAGWNAFSLWKTGRDDWLHAFPLHYDTFGDQRPTGFFYSAVPSLAIFGLNLFAIRFTSALFGSLAVIAVFFLVSELDIKNSKLKIKNYAAFLLALSPWHISLSRASSEGIIATTLLLFGLVYFLACLRQKSVPKLFLALVFLCLSYFFYHTTRILVPIFVLLTLVYYQFQTGSRKIWLPSVIALIIVSLLTLAFALTPAARSRLSQVSIFNDPGIKFELDRLPFEEGPNHVFITRMLHNKLVIYTTRFINEYTRYFSSDFFLTPGVARPVRYQTASQGLLLYAEYLLLVIGLFALIKKRLPALPAILLLAAPLPAALTTEDAPNLHRALVMIPFISVLAAFGLAYLASLNRRIFYLALLIFVLNFFYWSHMYIVHTPNRDEITLSRNAGVTNLISFLAVNQSAYDRILLTNRPDNLYPWYAFLTHADPKIFNPLVAPNKNTQFSYGKIIFSQYRCPSEHLSQNPRLHVLAVDAEGCQVRGSLNLVASINRSGGGHPYTLWTFNSL